MITINFANLEEFVLEKQDLVKLLLPKIGNQYNFWVLGRNHQALSGLTKTAILEILKTLNDVDCLEILQTYFKDKVQITSLDFETVKNIKIPINDNLCENLCFENFDNISTYRDADYLYISFWR